MTYVGQALIDSGGTIFEADDTFCTLLGADRDWVNGRSILSLTSEEDRDTVMGDLLGMISSHRPIRTTRRYLRQDGSPVRMRMTVSLVPKDGCSECAMIHAEPATQGGALDHPAILLECAQFLLAGDVAKSAVIPEHFAPAWDIVVSAYIAEATGRTFTLADCLELGGKGPAVCRRWISALEQAAILECEADGAGQDTYRLTASTVDRLEAYLRNVALECGKLVQLIGDERRMA